MSFRQDHHRSGTAFSVRLPGGPAVGHYAHADFVHLAQATPARFLHYKVTTVPFVVQK